MSSSTDTKIQTKPTDPKHKKPRRPKKFRFQVVADWLTSQYTPCKAADIGGGKGLLAYLLNEKGWDITVVDPVAQDLPTKYKDLETGKRVKVPSDATVPRITEPFKPEHAKEFDLLIGLHAHGSNMAIIDAAAEYNKDFFLIPCCVIDEPIEKRAGVNWRESLVEYAKGKGLDVKTAKLGFMGKDIALYTNTQ